ncbi:MAG: DUF1778 domain-containing protein [Acidimicrobiales bacterium]|jgi:uncharacterized protein (DUF1778 family)
MMTVKDNRREVRISADDDDLLAEAAGLAGVSVSEFLLDRAMSEAAKLVEAHRTIRLADEDHERFIAALDGPVRPPEELIAQARRARRLDRVD